MIRVLYLPTGTEHRTAVRNDNRTACGQRLFPGREAWLEADPKRRNWTAKRVCAKCAKEDNR